jgi:hypothetical protein
MNFNNYNVSVLLILIIALYLLYNVFLVKFINKRKPKSAFFIFVLDTLSAPTLVALTLILVNTYFYKYSIINPLLIDVPVVEGKYEGLVITGNMDTIPNKEYQVGVEIEQTGSSTLFCLHSGTASVSFSKFVFFSKKGTTNYMEIIYENERIDSPNAPNNYIGYSKFEIIGDSILKGFFFTDQHRKTYGKVYLKKIIK